MSTGLTGRSPIKRRPMIVSIFRHPIFPASLGITLFLLCLVHPSCTASFERRDAWEGFNHGTLRVCVKIILSDEMPHETKPRSVNQAILEAAGARASLILTSHSRINHLDPEQSLSCRSAIPEILRSGVIRFHRCSGDICTAFVDYKADSCVSTAAP